MVIRPASTRGRARKRDQYRNQTALETGYVLFEISRISSIMRSNDLASEWTKSKLSL
jgi:hypothetical protein